jgi:methylated-DNA-[protein]-cysteine S-methyltransferase
MFHAVLKFPAMHVGVRVEAGRVAEIAYLPFSVPLQKPADETSRRAAKQLQEYLADPDFAFDLPLEQRGSEFQRRVWKAIDSIPRGRTLTYGQVAKQLRSAPRAVGQACGANWFPLIIPCHRVVGAGGLGGFAHHGEGFHLEIKRWLLHHEKAL